MWGWSVFHQTVCLIADSLSDEHGKVPFVTPRAYEQRLRAESAAATRGASSTPSSTASAPSPSKPGQRRRDRPARRRRPLDDLHGLRLARRPLRRAGAGAVRPRWLPAAARRRAPCPTRARASAAASRPASRSSPAIPTCLPCPACDGEARRRRGRRGAIARIEEQRAAGMAWLARRLKRGRRAARRRQRRPGGPRALDRRELRGVRPPALGPGAAARPRSRRSW